MSVLRETTVSVRVCTLVFGIFTTVWYGVVLILLASGKSAPDAVPSFLAPIVLVAPFICPLLACLLIRIYVAEGRPHPWTFWPSMIFIVSPALIIAILGLL